MNEESSKQENNRGNDGRFLRGQSGHPEGRPRGSANKYTNLKDAFIKVFEDLGGTQGLYDWADESKHNKALFYGWITKMLPSSVTGGQDEEGEFKPLTVIIHNGNKPVDRLPVFPNEHDGGKPEVK